MRGRWLQPEIHSQEINCTVRDDPEEGALTHIDFRDATHAGTPPGLQSGLELTANDKDVFLFFCLRDRFDPLKLNREFQFRLAGESDWPLASWHPSGFRN